MEEHPYSDKRELPALYVNPWVALVRDIKSILSDLLLRFRELIRRNNQGLLPMPNFVKPTIKPFVFPTLLLTLLISFIFSIIFLSNSNPQTARTPINKVLKVATPISVDRTLELSSPNEKLSPPFELYSDKLTNNEAFLSKIEGDEYLVKAYHEVIKLVDISLLDNGVIIKLDTAWSNLQSEEKIELINRLNECLEIVGYRDLRILDESEFLIARRSRIGKGMIFFKEDHS